VTVIATGFDGGGPPPSPVPRFEVERDRDREGPRLPRRDDPPPSRGRAPIFDQGESSSLEIDDDDIDVPPFLKDT
jgi:hypothetical protein